MDRTLIAWWFTSDGSGLPSLNEVGEEFASHALVAGQEQAARDLLGILLTVLPQEASYERKARAVTLAADIMDCLPTPRTPTTGAFILTASRAVGLI